MHSDLQDVCPILVVLELTQNISSIDFDPYLAISKSMCSKVNKYKTSGWHLLLWVVVAAFTVTLSSFILSLFSMFTFLSSFSFRNEWKIWNYFSSLKNKHSQGYRLWFTTIDLDQRRWWFEENVCHFNFLFQFLLLCFWLCWRHWFIKDLN